MAAATVTGRQQNQVFGARRRVGANSIAFANTGDTWTVPGIKRIEQIDLTPTSNASYGFTVSGNILTLTAGAGVTFLGGVLGL